MWDAARGVWRHQGLWLWFYNRNGRIYIFICLLICKNWQTLPWTYELKTDNFFLLVWRQDVIFWRIVKPMMIYYSVANFVVSCYLEFLPGLYNRFPQESIGISVLRIMLQPQAARHQETTSFFLRILRTILFLRKKNRMMLWAYQKKFWNKVKTPKAAPGGWMARPQEF